MSIVKGVKTYITEPYNVLDYGVKKLDGSAPKIIIGKYTSIARNTTFINSHHRMDTFTTYGSGYSKGDIIIGSDCWIGANCTIMDNVKIGDGAVIGAGCVVTRDIEPYSIVGGVPAKIIKYRFPEEIRNKLKKLNFWGLEDSIIQKFNMNTTDIESFIILVQKTLNIKIE
jgi:virginiamycin A acetyltransferase